MGNSVDTGTPRSVGSRRKDWTSVGENQTIPFQFSFLSDPFAHVVRSLHWVKMSVLFLNTLVKDLVEVSSSRRPS